MTSIPVRRALVSVYDKSGLVEFVEGLRAAGVEIVSSGGTAATLAESGIDVTAVSEVTHSPEILGGRVKTLHPKIHGGILGRPDNEADRQELQDNDIELFQLVVVNLYPFRETVADRTADEAEIVEKIDIGGPAMVRAAAKNFSHVGIVTSPAQYARVAKAISEGGLGEDLRRELAAEAFFQTSAYDGAITEWLGNDRVLALRREGDLRYGENPHQDAAVFVEDRATPWWTKAVQHQGKEMSFNNYADAEAAWTLATDLKVPGAVVVKHTNPCGAAQGGSPLEAFERAWDGDPMSAFGGVVAVNGTIDEATALAISQKFVEVIVASEVDPAALTVLASKKNLRVLSAPAAHRWDPDYRRLEDGFLIQDRDTGPDVGWEVVSERSPTAEEQSALEFAWKLSKAAKSNAVVMTVGEQAVGVGAGDQSRVGAAERAVAKAGSRAQGSVAASDAFFPFRDGLDVLAVAGVGAIVEPGGSRNDQEVIDAANEHGIALVFTGGRHFRH